MSLTSALGIAQRSLFNTSRQTTIVSRNVSEQNNADYARRAAILVSTTQGARIAQVQRATNEVLFRQNLSAISSASGHQALSAGLDQLARAANGGSDESSFASLLGRFEEALEIYSAAPSNRNLANEAVESARDISRALNQATAAVQGFRADADGQIKSAVDDLNTYLKEFQSVNQEVVKGTPLGHDINDALDRRDLLLKQISEIVPVSTIGRADNDMMLMTADGIMLFETVPRTVSFSANSTYDANQTGNRVYIDGVPLARGTNAASPGTIGALMHLRDEVAPTLQNQLDEMAHAMVNVFGPTGLFETTPPIAITDKGFAGAIRINAAYDGMTGGDPELLRGPAGTAISDNTQLRDFLTRLADPISISADAGLGSGSKALGAFATDSISWIESQRRSAAQSLESKNALILRTSSALSNMTGVNIDEELSLLLELEQSYQASARIIKAVDDMLKTLMAAVN